MLEDECQKYGILLIGETDIVRKQRLLQRVPNIPLTSRKMKVTIVVLELKNHETDYSSLASKAVMYGTMGQSNVFLLSRTLNIRSFRKTKVIRCKRNIDFSISVVRLKKSTDCYFQKSKKLKYLDVP